MDYSMSDRGRREATKPGADGTGGGVTTNDRLGGHGGYRGSRRDAAGLTGDHVMNADLSRPGLGPSLEVVASSPLDSPSVGPSMSIGELDSLSEPVFTPTGWMDVPSSALVDHPLVRGLMMELPPRGSAPDPDWLDRWFDAARSILALLYVERAISRR